MNEKQIKNEINTSSNADMYDAIEIQFNSLKLDELYDPSGYFEEDVFDEDGTIDYYRYQAFIKERIERMFDEPKNTYINIYLERDGNIYAGSISEGKTEKTEDYKYVCIHGWSAKIEEEKEIKE